MSLLDYRDRTSVMIWVVLMGLAAQRFLTLPAQSFAATVLGSPITITITANTVLAVLLAGLVASGTAAVVRVHPRSRRVRSAAPSTAGAQSGLPALDTSFERRESNVPGSWIFWGLPVALIVVALLLMPLAPSLEYWLFGLIATGAMLGLSMAGIYYTVDPYQTGYRRARLGLNLLTYAVALVLFLVVYRTRTRSIVSATQVMAVSTLLALELLRGSERPIPLVALYAGIVGLVLGQATWVLNYWRLDSLTGGLVLLVLFYDAVGLAQNFLQGRLRRRVLLEYALITIAAMALIWEFAP